MFVGKEDMIATPFCRMDLDDFSLLYVVASSLRITYSRSERKRESVDTATTNSQRGECFVVLPRVAIISRTFQSTPKCMRVDPALLPQS